MEVISEFDSNTNIGVVTIQSMGTGTKVAKAVEKVVEEELINIEGTEHLGEAKSIAKPELDLSVSQLDGVGAVTQKKLETFGVKNLIDICVRGSREVSEITGVSKATTDTWVFKAQKLLEENEMIRKSDMGVMDLMDYHEQLPTVSTGCTEVDDLMGGGVRPEATYEIYGEFGAGKTQFCNTLTCNAIAEDGNVIWIDCEDTFKPRRIVEILMAREEITQEDAKEKLNNITYL